jgi:GGDEF domain-containing protein
MTEANIGRPDQPGPTLIIPNQEGSSTTTEERPTTETDTKSLEERLAEKDRTIEDLTRQLAEARADVATANTRADEAEQVVEQARQEANEAKARANEAEQRSLIDPLTGCRSRYAWEDLQKHFDISRGENAAILMIDLNGFKEINDSLGHLFGDEHLKKVASYFNENFERRGDKVYRYGGDEFSIVCNYPEDKNKFEDFVKTLFNHNQLSREGLDFSYGMLTLTLKQTKQF